MQEFNLQYPIAFNGETITQIQMRRVKGSDIQALAQAKGNAVAGMFDFYASLSGQDPKLFREMDAEDLQAIGKWLKPVLDPNDEESGTAGS